MEYIAVRIVVVERRAGKGSQATHAVKQEFDGQVMVNGERSRK